MKSTISTKASQIQRNWHLVDVKDQVLGRIATRIAGKLIGKQKEYYVPYLDCGDYVVVVNASQIKVTGKKAKQKMYSNYSGYPGGLKQKSFEQMMEHDPKKVVLHAVSGMLPKNKLKAKMLKRLYIYPDMEHPYGAKLS